MRPIVVVGDALLDRDVDGEAHRLVPDAPVPVLEEAARHARPGGAALAAALLAGDGRPVTLVCALGADPAGRELAGLLAGAGVTLIDLGLRGPTPEKVRFRAGEVVMLRVDRGGGPAPPGPFDEPARQALAQAAAVLVADYGRGITAQAAVRAGLPVGGAGGRRVPVVWDPHPRGTRPVAGAALVTPNVEELMEPGSVATGPGDLAPITARARTLRTEWRAGGVAVTLGRRGALLVEDDGPPMAVPAVPSHRPDTCGAGDRFSSAATGALADGGVLSEAVEAGVRAAEAFVAHGGAGGFSPRPAALGSVGSPGSRPGDPCCDAVVLAHRYREAGGTVVATGGCFDLLHAGHVAMLREARALGSCLIVCLNSDRSVRRLKGPGRPLVPQSDRAAVLQALDCVDAVALFDEDTPDAVLGRLRPHVFAKGGDYAGVRLPEDRTMSSWGGHTVVLPYLAGRSTTGLVFRATTGDVRPA